MNCQDYLLISGKAIGMVRNGIQVLPIMYDAIAPDDYGMVKFKKEGEGWSYLLPNHKVVKSDGAEFYTDGITYYKLRNQNFCSIYSFESGKLIHSGMEDYFPENGIIVYRNKGKLGALNFKGDVLVDSKYEGLIYIPEVNDFLVVERGKYNFLYKPFDRLSKSQFNFIRHARDDYFYLYSENGFGFFKYENGQLIKPEMKGIYWLQNYFVFSSNGKHRIYDDQLKFIAAISSDFGIDQEIDSTLLFRSGSRYALLDRDGWIDNDLIGCEARGGIFKLYKTDTLKIMMYDNNQRTFDVYPGVQVVSAEKKRIVPAGFPKSITEDIVALDKISGYYENYSCRKGKFTRQPIFQKVMPFYRLDGLGFKLDSVSDKEFLGVNFKFEGQLAPIKSGNEQLSFYKTINYRNRSFSNATSVNMAWNDKGDLETVTDQFRHDGNIAQALPTHFDSIWKVNFGGKFEINSKGNYCYKLYLDWNDYFNFCPASVLDYSKLFDPDARYTVVGGQWRLHEINDIKLTFKEEVAFADVHELKDGFMVYDGLTFHKLSLKNEIDWSTYAKDFYPITFKNNTVYSFEYDSHKYDLFSKDGRLIANELTGVEWLDSLHFVVQRSNEQALFTREGRMVQAFSSAKPLWVDGDYVLSISGNQYLFKNFKVDSLNFKGNLIFDDDDFMGLKNASEWIVFDKKSKVVKLYELDCFKAYAGYGWIILEANGDSYLSNFDDISIRIPFDNVEYCDYKTISYNLSGKICFAQKSNNLKVATFSVKYDWAANVLGIYWIVRSKKKIYLMDAQFNQIETLKNRFFDERGDSIFFEASDGKPLALLKAKNTKIKFNRSLYLNEALSVNSILDVSDTLLAKYSEVRSLVGAFYWCKYKNFTKLLDESGSMLLYDIQNVKFFGSILILKTQKAYHYYNLETKAFLDWSPHFNSFQEVESKKTFSLLHP